MREVGAEDRPYSSAELATADKLRLGRSSDLKNRSPRDSVSSR
jgi:hypothetical protein